MPRRVRREQRVVRERHPRHRAATEPLLRHEAHAEFPAPSRSHPSRLRLEDLHGKFLRQRLLAGYCIHELLLAVTRNTGDADDFAGAHFEMDVPEVGPERIVGGMREAGQTQAHFAVFGGHSMLRHGKILSDHHPRHRFRRLLGRFACSG